MRSGRRQQARPAGRSSRRCRPGAKLTGRRYRRLQPYPGQPGSRPPV